MKRQPTAKNRARPRDESGAAKGGSAWNRLTPIAHPQLIGYPIRALYPRVEPELARLAEYVPRGGTAVDVGGWFGPWTKRLIPLADQVVTVEAVPAMAHLLRRAFPQVQVVQAAASDRCGETDIWIPHVGPYAGVSSVENSLGIPVKVPQITLDSLEIEHVSFIKMDIEGHELAALHGARETIERDHPVLIVELEERHRPIAPVLELLGSFGYTGHVLTEGHWVALDEFDLIGHQKAAVQQVERSLISRILRPGPRYINTVLFRRM